MTTTIENSTLHCDKCGRIIDTGKGYTNIGGWIICGLCQYYDDLPQNKNEGWMCPRCGKIHSYLSLTCDCPIRWRVGTTYPIS